MTDRDIQAAGQPGGGDTSGTGAGIKRSRPWSVVANRKRKALAILMWVKAAAREGYYCVDGEFHAETRRSLGEYGLCEFDPNGSIIPSDDPLVRI